MRLLKECHQWGPNQRVFTYSDDPNNECLSIKIDDEWIAAGWKKDSTPKEEDQETSQFTNFTLWFEYED